MARIRSADGRVYLYCPQFIRSFRPARMDYRLDFLRRDIDHFDLHRADRHPSALLQIKPRPRRTSAGSGD